MQLLNYQIFMNWLFFDWWALRLVMEEYLAYLVLIENIFLRLIKSCWIVRHFIVERVEWIYGSCSFESFFPQFLKVFKNLLPFFLCWNFEVLICAHLRQARLFVAIRSYRTDFLFGDIMNCHVILAVSQIHDIALVPLR